MMKASSLRRNEEIQKTVGSQWKYNLMTYSTYEKWNIEEEEKKENTNMWKWLRQIIYIIIMTIIMMTNGKPENETNDNGQLLMKMKGRLQMTY